MRRRLVVAAIVLHLVVGLVAMACPQCRYSPNGWGFCRYLAYAGPYDCVEYVVDPWSGRTDCYTCGYCNWSDPNSSEMCNAGPSGGLPVLTKADRGFSWIGQPVAQVAVF